MGVGQVLPIWDGQGSPLRERDEKSIIGRKSKGNAFEGEKIPFPPRGKFLRRPPSPACEIIGLSTT